MKQTDALQHGRMAVKDHFPDMGEQEREQIAFDEVFGVISYLLHESESHHNIMKGSVDEQMDDIIYLIRFALIERKKSDLWNRPMSVQEPEYIVIRSRAQLVYCPLCGTETELMSREYSSEIVCPNHGELLLD